MTSDGLLTRYLTNACHTYLILGRQK
jgi:hypothetical protein